MAANNSSKGKQDVLQAAKLAICTGLSWAFADIQDNDLRQLPWFSALLGAARSISGSHALLAELAHAAGSGDREVRAVFLTDAVAVHAAMFEMGMAWLLLLHMASLMWPASFQKAAAHSQ